MNSSRKEGFDDYNDVLTIDRIESRDYSLPYSPGSSYKDSSYIGGNRGELVPGGMWTSYYDKANNITGDVMISNGNEGTFSANVPNLPYAPYQGNGMVMSNNPEDLFNINTALPRDNGKNWFGEYPEVIGINDSNLLSTDIKAGIKTTNTRKCGAANHDIRPVPVIEKRNVPFGNSSMDPEFNFANLM